MKNILFFIFVLINLTGFSQYSTSIDFADAGGYQFKEQIEEIIKQAVDKKIEKVEIQFTEYYIRKNDSLKRISLHSKALFSLSSDSTFMVSINDREGDKNNFAYGDHYRIVTNGIYKHIGSFNTPLNKQIQQYKKRVLDYEKIITSKKDSTVIEFYEYDTLTTWHGKFDANLYSTIEYDSTLVSAFYFNSNNELLKKLYRSNDNSINSFVYKYFPKDSLTITYRSSKNSNYTIIKKKEIIKWGSEVSYIKKEAIEYISYYTDKKTNEKKINQHPRKTAIFQYKLNKQGLPVKIKIIETINYDSSDAMNPVKGSIMKIKYKY